MISAMQAQAQLEKYYYEQRKNRPINRKELESAKKEIENIVLEAIDSHKTHIIVDYSCKVLVSYYLIEICEWLWDFGYRTFKQKNSELMISWGKDE